MSPESDDDRALWVDGRWVDPAPFVALAGYPALLLMFYLVGGYSLLRELMGVESDGTINPFLVALPAILVAITLASSFVLPITRIRVGRDGVLLVTRVSSTLVPWNSWVPIRKKIGTSLALLQFRRSPSRSPVAVFLTQHQADAIVRSRWWPAAAGT